MTPSQFDMLQARARSRVWGSPGSEETVGLVCALLATPPPPLPFAESPRRGESLCIAVPEYLLLRAPLTPPRVAVNLHYASDLGPQGSGWLDPGQAD